MSGRTIGAFALGFACGLVTLGVFVARNRVSVPTEPVQGEAHRALPDPLPAPPPGPPPAVSEPPASGPPPSAPPSAPFVGPRVPVAEPPRSTSPARLHLAIPIAGVKPADLVNSFHDSR